MKKPNIFLIVSSLVATSVIVSGCGSSNSDSDTSSVDQTKITQINAKNVANSAMTTLRIMGQLVVGQLNISEIIGMLNQPANAVLPLQLRTIVPPQDVACSGSGSLTLSGDAVDPTLGSLAPGDTIQIVYNNCEELTGVTTSGTIDLTIQNFSGSLSAPPYSYTLALESSDLSAAQRGETETLNGSAILMINTEDGAEVTTTVSVDSLDYTEQASEDSGTLTDFTATVVTNFGALSYTLDSSGTVSSQTIGGSVTLMTTEIIMGSLLEENPGSGVVLVTGDTSTETITVIDPINLRLDIDENGDGTIDDIIPTTWEEIFAL